MFTSGLISSPMFPAFQSFESSTDLPAFRNFIENWQPAAPSDHTKALVWGFAAGFSERFVPNLLEYFVKSVQENEREPRKPADGTYHTK